MTKGIKYWFFVFFLFRVSLVYAQEDKAFTIFSTGNVFVENVDTLLLNQWRTQAAIPDNFAVLLPNGPAVPVKGKILLNS
ncbi:MAG: hypothetical protein LC658_03840 [Bacteroidales bacterium]|nr:hypothetical protein [Bacteroidales bacterium]